MDTIKINFKQMSMICDKRVASCGWYDADECPDYDWTCTNGDIESESPSVPVIGKEHECKQELCPFWKRFSTEGSKTE